MKDVLIRQDTYKKPGIKIPDDELPTMPHAFKSLVVVEAYVLRAGNIERNGKRLIFHDVRVYFKEDSDAG